MVMEKDLFGETESSLEESSSDEEQVPAATEVGGHEREKQQDGSPSASSSGSSSSSSSESEGEEIAVPPAETVPDSQFPSTQDLFGGHSSSSSSSSGEEDGSEQNENRQEEELATSEAKVATSDSDAGAEGGLRQVKDLFGDAGDLSSSDEGSPTQPLDGVQANRTEREEEEEEDREVPRIDVSIPRCVAQLGSDIYFIKLPNFLSIETRPFDPQLYEDETEDDAELLDEDGRTRLKLKVENTIRWRQAQNELGEETKESNARIVRWSDGSMSLYLGSEIFDIYRQALQGEHSHLFVRQGTGLQGQAVFKHKLTFRPHSTDSHTHRKMTLSIADRFSKAQKIRVLPVVGKDPETQRIDKIKKEEQRLRESVRLESRRRRVRERYLKKDLTSSYLEGDEDLEENEESVSAIKSSMKARVRQGTAYSESEEEDSGEERLLQAKRESGFGKKRQSDADVPQVRKKGRRVVSDDEDSDE